MTCLQLARHRFDRRSLSRPPNPRAAAPHPAPPSKKPTQSPPTPRPWSSRCPRPLPMTRSPAPGTRPARRPRRWTPTTWVLAPGGLARRPAVLRFLLHAPVWFGRLRCWASMILSRARAGAEPRVVHAARRLSHLAHVGVTPARFLSPFLPTSLLPVDRFCPVSRFAPTVTTDAHVGSSTVTVPPGRLGCEQSQTPRVNG